MEKSFRIKSRFPPKTWLMMAFTRILGLGERLRRRRVAIAILSFVTLCVGLLLAGYLPSLLDKTVWEWMELFIVPVALAAAGLWFANVQKKTELGIAERERQADRELALDKQRQQTLENYLDRMKELILDRGLGPEATPKVMRLASTLTLNALRELDAKRNRQITRFLQEANLLWGNGISLREADLREAELSGAALSGADLVLANLEGAKLNQAYLNGASLEGANLYGANLAGARLEGANLHGANLVAARLNSAKLNRANLNRAMLVGAELLGANLEGASLEGAILARTDQSGFGLEAADLRWANLSGAIVTTEQLAQTGALEGAIMPDGKTYTDGGSVPAPQRVQAGDSKAQSERKGYRRQEGPTMPDSMGAVLVGLALGAVISWLYNARSRWSALPSNRKEPPA